MIFNLSDFDLYCVRHLIRGFPDSAVPNMFHDFVYWMINQNIGINQFVWIGIQGIKRLHSMFCDIQYTRYKACNSYISHYATAAVFTKGLSRVLGLTFVQKYSQLEPETWLRPFVNTAPEV